jgi:cytochrome c553
LCLVCPALLLNSTPARAQAAPASPLFEKDVLPILQAKCLRCHGDKTQKATLDLRTRAAIVQGGESGAALLPGSAEKSPLWIMIAGDRMPPGKTKLTAAEKGVLKVWIDSGARTSAPEAPVAPRVLVDRQVTDADRQFWSFQPPVRPPVPAVRQAGRVRNAVDAFILAALEKKGLGLSPEADRQTLIRRLALDLTGLPPSPSEVEAFVNDPASDAYEKLVERLLASPAYGERWGRHWLDLAGYADSEGILNADYVRTAAWRYRDYVIRAFNADMPYDRFLKEQIAGDELTDYWTAYQTRKELPAEVVEGLTATGYLRCASDTSRPDFVKIKDAPGYYYQTLDDTLKILASGVLGLTVQCARCHSHKYDPIPQTDYYRLQAIFMSAYRPSQWVPQVERHLLAGTASQVQEKQRSDAAIASLAAQLKQLQPAFAGRLFADRLAALPEVIRADVKLALATAPNLRSEVQKYLAGKFQNELRPPPAGLDAILDKSYPEYKSKREALQASINAEKAKVKPLAEIRALYDLPGEVKTQLLRRGDYLNPGMEVQPGVLSVLATPKPFQWTPPPKDAKTSKRRLAFAEWLTQPGHPLTGRVLVNRVWLQHFGEGLVSTPDNFGRAGAAPSHPELLDYLATEFVAKGWSIKGLHRLLLTSSTYRQASALRPGLHDLARKVDPDNRLLWRQRLRRLEAEALRDSILQVSGSLNREMFGPPVPMLHQPDGEVVAPADASGLRRSVYLQVRRSQPLTLLQVFDQPVLETNCTRRGNSTVASQALTLLNSDFLVRQAEAFAGRVLKEKPADPAVEALSWAYGRPATAREKEVLTAFLQQQTERHAATDRAGAPRKAVADLCQMLLGSNEFAYVD